MARARHLHDDRLYECYLAARDGDALDPPAAEHLSDCPACGARFDELSDFLNTVRIEGTHESDAQFTPERLLAQREHIARVIEHAGRSARVIGFPGRVTQHLAYASARVAPRWLAAAAAAGLFVGVAVGAMLRESRGASSLAAANAAVAPAGARLAPPPAIVVAPPPAVSEAIDDERFLMELELALEHQNTRELQPFDALMPRAREISSQAR